MFLLPVAIAIPMPFATKRVSLVVFASVVDSRLDHLATSLVGAMLYLPVRHIAEGVPLVVCTSVVGRVDDLAARLVGASLHLRQAALAVRARSSEFVDFLDAVRAQAEVTCGWGDGLGLPVESVGCPGAPPCSRDASRSLGSPMRTKRARKLKNKPSQNHAPPLCPFLSAK